MARAAYRTLLLEPHGPTRARLAALLKARGHTVAEVANPAEADPALGGQPADLMLCALPAGAERALALLRALRGLPGGAGAYLLALPGRSPPARRGGSAGAAALLAAGADDLLPKPCGDGALAQRLEIAEAHARRRRSAPGGLGTEAAAVDPGGRWRELLDALPILFWAADEQRRFTVWNRECERVTGYSAAEIVGNPQAETLLFPDPAYRRAFGGMVLEFRDDFRDLQITVQSKHAGPKTLLATFIFRNFSVPGWLAWGVGVDITDYRRTEQSLAANRRLLNTIVDTLPVGVFVKDPAGRFQMVNPAFAAISGADPEQLVGKTTMDLPGFNPQAAAQVRQSDEQVLAEGRVMEMEDLSTFSRDGQAVWIHAYKSPLRDDDGTIVGIVGVTEDVSAKRRAEDELRASRTLLQTVFDTIPTGIAVKDREGRYVSANRAICELWNARPEDFLGKRVLFEERRPAEEVSRTVESDREVLETGRTREVTTPQTLPDGRMRLMSGIKTPLRNDQGEVTGLIVMTQDITERKQAEDELTRSRALLQAVFDTIPHEVFVKDREGRYLAVNRATAGLWGLRPEAIRGEQAVSAGTRPAEEVQYTMSTDLEVLTTGQVNEAIHPTTLPDGRRRLMRIIKNPLRDAQGRVIGLVGISEDITDRQRTEDEVRAARRLLQTVFDTIPVSLWVKDQDGRVTMVNKALLERFQTTEEQVLGQRVIQPYPIPEDERRLTLASDTQVLETGMGEEREVTRTLPGGEMSFSRVIKQPLLDEQKRVVGLVGLAWDITERKRAEDALRRSQALLQAVFDTIPHAVFVKDLDGRYLAVNRAMAERWATRPEDAVGHKTIAGERRPAEESERTVRADRAVLDSGRGYEAMLATTLLDGRKRVIRAIKNPLRDAYGNVVGLVGVSEDVTDKVRAEEELRAGQRLLQTVIDSLPQSIYVKDLEGRYQMVNTTVSERLGLAPADLIGKTVAALPLGNPAATELIRAADRKLMETGAMVEIPELRTAPRGSRERWVRLFKVPLRGDDNRLVGSITITEDITRQRQAEAARLELERQVLHGQKLESLGVLAGGIAHDFNNLLTGIMGNAELALLDLDDAGPVRSYVDAIKQASVRAAALTQQMLAYSGKGRLQSRPVNLSAMVEEIAQLLKVSISKQVVVRYDLDPALPAIEADPTQLQQVVMNLITNASEAIGDAVGSIRLATGQMTADRDYLAQTMLGEGRPAGRYVYVEVADSGSGMTKEVQAKIFDPFFTTKFTGRGLGMAAVLGIVRGHRGAVWIETAPGKGSTFRVLFPPSERAAEAADPGPPAGAAWKGAGTVLVVDDEATVRDVLQRQLESLGFTVLTAANGQEGLEVFARRQGEIAAVLLDLTMPVLSGEETYRELRRIGGAAPIIVCSGYSEQDAAERFRDDPPDGFLQKPAPLGAVLEKLRQVLGG